MPDDLLPYYERELSFLRQLGAEYADKYPKIAGRLLLEAGKCEDPHVERLIQAFAFLAARIQRKIDDEFPEICESLLNVLYPHYLNPLPSMSLVQFVLDPEQGKLTSGYRIARGTMLYSQPVDGAACRFRTCYPVTLWPLEVASARFDAPDRLAPSSKAARVIRLELRCVGGTAFSELDIDQLRFCLHGESALVYRLYELLFNHTLQVQLRPLSGAGGVKPIILSPQCLQPVGFGPDEAILPYSPRSFMGYRLLQEYFAFAEKFLFVDLGELRRAAQAEFREGVEVLIYLDQVPRVEQALSAENFRLGCTPIVNLFELIAEPIRLTHTESEYRVIPDVRRPNATEVYSVDEVLCTDPDLHEPMRFEPFYSFRHATERERQRAFWYTTRRPSARKGDAGTEVYLSLVDLDFRPAVPAVETLTTRVTCTNRDLPARLPFGGEAARSEALQQRGDFELEGAAPLSRIRCLKKPTETVRPPQRRGVQWRLISHLSLNHLSIGDGDRGAALREILKLYDFSDSAILRQQIEGITNVASRRVIRRAASGPASGFCRGIEVTVEFDEEKYVGSGAFLFSSVLDRFLALYASLNSFTQLVAVTQQREGPLKRWPPRAGEQILL
jgi:type VI secretion system protein ImpG